MSCNSKHPANFKDLTGQMFGHLTVIEIAGKRKSGEVMWLCQCDCGKQATVLVTNLLRGNSTSCGCMRSQNRPQKTFQEYEEAKRNEFSKITNKWEYVRCYDRSKSKHTIRCTQCGNEKVVKCLREIPECSACKKREKERQRKQSKYKVCAVCGKEFESTRSTAIYCSERCSKAMYKERNIDRVREKQRTRKRLREARAMKNGKVDYTITLSKLIERDKHICKLCGREVNENDYIYIVDTFIAGNDYPSIDHIKPLSKGGVHQWDNVQLAHRLCNSIKNDNVS